MEDATRIPAASYRKILMIKTDIDKSSWHGHFNNIMRCEEKENKLCLVREMLAIGNLGLHS